MQVAELLVPCIQPSNSGKFPILADILGLACDQEDIPSCRISCQFWFACVLAAAQTLCGCSMVLPELAFAAAGKEVILRKIQTLPVV